MGMPKGFEGQPVNIEKDAQGEPLFRAKDVVERLGYEGYSNISHVLERQVDEGDRRKTTTAINLGTYNDYTQARFVNESGTTIFFLRFWWARWVIHRLRCAGIFRFRQNLLLLVCFI
jgi:hypothetical protein